MTGKQFQIEWHDSGREPQVKPNPKYPNGIDLDGSHGQPSCVADLPYPANRCGVYVVVCKQCGTKVAATTAGRRDDPRTIRMACRLGTKQ